MEEEIVQQKEAGLFIPPHNEATRFSVVIGEFFPAKGGFPKIEIALVTEGSRASITAIYAATAMSLGLILLVGFICVKLVT